MTNCFSCCCCFFFLEINHALSHKWINGGTNDWKICACTVHRQVGVWWGTWCEKEVVSSPGQTRERPVRLVEAWHQSPAQETSCRCRSPGWSLRQPAAPWRSHSAGMGSCNGARWAGTGCLGPEWFNTVKHTSASNCNYARSPLGCESY